MSKGNEEERKRFEDWVKLGGWTDSDLCRFPEGSGFFSGDYEDDAIRNMWSGWQAAMEGFRLAELEKTNG